MRRTGSSEHYFTVRGRGFDTKQWRAILELAEGIVRRANQAGIEARYEGDARRVVVSPGGLSKDATEQHSLVIWRKGEPGIPKNVVATGQFDAVVQSILVATKKVAPDIFVMTTPDGRDYRRLLAKQNDGRTTEEIKEITKRTRQQKDDAFMQAVRRQHWVHPETKNQVEFVSLPKKEQTKIRHQWDAEYGRRWDTMADRAIKKLREAEREKAEAQRAKEQAEDAAKDFKQQKQKAQTGEVAQPRKAADMNDEIIRKAAIRVAATTDDKDLKHTLLEILRGTAKEAKLPPEFLENAQKKKDEAKGKKDDEDDKGDDKKASSHDDKEKESRHEEGKDVDVGDYLKSKGHHEDAAKWEKHEGDMGKKSNAAVVFPEIHELAWRHVVDYNRANPESKTAAGSTADRMAAADRLAKKWISDAIKRPGRVHEYLGIPEGEDIPMGKLDAAIEKVKGTGNKSLLSALQLAKRLKGMKKKKKADAEPEKRPSVITPQNFPEIHRLAGEQVKDFLDAQAETKTAAVTAEFHEAMTGKLAKKWISDAIKRPGRVREYLGVPEGEDIPMGKLNDAIEKVKGTGNKSLLSALLLAKRLKGMKAAAKAA